MIANLTMRPLLTNQLVKVAGTGTGAGVEREGVVLGTSPREVLVAFPNDDALPEAFAIGAAARIKTWDQLGLYEGATSILRHLDRAIVGVGVALSVPGAFSTIQRRSSLRVHVRLPFTFVVKLAQDSRIALNVTSSGSTEDVSAGGMRFATDLPLSVGDQLEVSIVFTLQTTPMVRQATVVRTIFSPAVGLTVGLQFSGAERSEPMIGELFRIQHRGPG
jgi:hypothetical protein